MKIPLISQPNTSHLRDATNQNLPTRKLKTKKEAQSTIQFARAPKKLPPYKERHAIRHSSSSRSRLSLGVDAPFLSQSWHSCGNTPFPRVKVCLILKDSQTPPQSCTRSCPRLCSSFFIALDFNFFSIFFHVLFVLQASYLCN